MHATPRIAKIRNIANMRVCGRAHAQVSSTSLMRKEVERARARGKRCVPDNEINFITHQTRRVRQDASSSHPKPPRKNCLMFSAQACILTAARARGTTSIHASVINRAPRLGVAVAVHGLQHFPGAWPAAEATHQPCADGVALRTNASASIL